VSVQSVTRTVTGATTVTFVFLVQPGVTDTVNVMTAAMKFQDAEVVSLQPGSISLNPNTIHSTHSALK